MRIALVNSYYAPAMIGGVETVVKALAEGLAEAGHDVHVFTTGSTDDHFSVDGIPVTQLRHCNFHWAPEAHGKPYLHRVLWHARAAANLGGAPSLGRAIRAFQPDIVHLHNISETGPLTYAALRLFVPGVPVVQTVHGFWHTCIRQTYLDRCTSKACAAWRAYVRPWTRLGVDAFVTPSRFVANELQPSGLTRRKIVRVISNAIPDLAGNTNESSPTSDTLRVLYLGQLQAEKGVLTLLKAADLLQAENIEITIAGAGPLTGQVQDAAGIRYVGWLGGQEKERALASADLLVFPSECQETFGMSILEAMRLGKPVIGTRVGAIPELISDRVNGRLVAPRSPVDIADALREVVRDRDLLVRWGAEASRTASNHSRAAMVASHISLYSELRV